MEHDSADDWHSGDFFFFFFLNEALFEFPANYLGGRVTFSLTLTIPKVSDS